jgi:D-alanine--poly(phosphoribitol) ligase subunit 2
MENITEKVLKLVRDLTENNDVQFNTNLLDEGILDSLTTIELISKLEDEFKINIDSEDLNHQNFNTVSKIEALIQKILQ